MKIDAIFEDGVFKPREPVGLPEGCEVMVELLGVGVVDEVPPAVKLLLAMKNRTREEIEEARRQLQAISPSTTPLPPGKTLSDIWPGPIRGEETEEQVREALEKLS